MASEPPKPRPGPASVILVGQMPPPYTGQNVMTELTVRGSYANACIHHVPTDFSRSVDEMRALQLRKLRHLLVSIARIVVARVRHRARVLYYTPTPVGGLPVARDVVTLLATRWMFGRTIFHFHAAGMVPLLEQAQGLRRAVLWRAYGRPDVAIRLSALAPQDGLATQARAEVVIRNPAPPVPVDGVTDDSPHSDVPVVLCVGALSPDKGLHRLLEVTRLLRDRGLVFQTHLVGDYSSSAVRADAEAFVGRHGLRGTVVHHGVQVGAVKCRLYARASVFCFLTSYPVEVYPLVLVEATQAGLPIVTTRWSAIPDMVSEGENAFLVEPDDVEGAARHVADLLTDQSLQTRMAAASLRRAQAELTVAGYWQAIDGVFASLRG